jgi:glycosyltransferase involved in cell wall biosynthesis
MVSRITPAKGHHVLLEALERLKPCDERKIVLLGAPAPGNVRDAEYLSSLRRWAAERGFECSIHWAGYQADPYPYYEAMDVLAVPSVGEEGIGLVILEAFQHGVPVVASLTGGIPELVKDGVNGILVPPGDAEKLATALERLQFEPDLCRQLGAGARASIDQRFSRELYCSTLSNLISELCASSRPAGAVPD